MDVSENRSSEDRDPRTDAATPRSSTTTQAATRRETLAGAGYTASGIAALAMIASLMVAGWFDQDRTSDLYHFQHEFYALAAQVLPVLLLTVAVERRFFGPEMPGADTLSSILAFLLLIICAVIGEVTALLVTAFHEPGATLQGYASITASSAIVGTLVLILWQTAVNSGVIATVENLWQDVLDEDRRQQRFKRELPLLVGVGVVAAVAVAVGAAIAAVRFVNQHLGDIQRVGLGAVYVLLLILWLRVSIAVKNLLMRGGRRAALWLRNGTRRSNRAA
jgi:hypothetical protein